MQRPNKHPEWARNDVVQDGENNVEEPSPDYKDTGWKPNIFARLQHSNWLHRFAGRWTKFLEWAMDILDANQQTIDGNTEILNAADLMQFMDFDLKSAQQIVDDSTSPVLLTDLTVNVPFGLLGNGYRVFVEAGIYVTNQVTETASQNDRAIISDLRMGFKPGASDPLDNNEILAIGSSGFFTPTDYQSTDPVGNHHFVHLIGEATLAGPHGVDLKTGSFGRSIVNGPAAVDSNDSKGPSWMRIWVVKPEETLNDFQSVADQES